jgi:hypothetical protein
MERFTECVLPYLDAAHNLARYLVRDPHEAEEAVQEAFLRAIRHLAITITAESVREGNGDADAAQGKRTDGASGAANVGLR